MSNQPGNGSLNRRFMLLNSKITFILLLAFFCVSCKPAKRPQATKNTAPLPYFCSAFPYDTNIKVISIYENNKLVCQSKIKGVSLSLYSENCSKHYFVFVCENIGQFDLNFEYKKEGDVITLEKYGERRVELKPVNDKRSIDDFTGLKGGGYFVKPTR